MLDGDECHEEKGSRGRKGWLEAGGVAASSQRGLEGLTETGTTEPQLRIKFSFGDVSSHQCMATPS